MEGVCKTEALRSRQDSDIVETKWGWSGGWEIRARNVWLPMSRELRIWEEQVKMEAHRTGGWSLVPLSLVGLGGGSHLKSQQ